jgi:hypothetical protein
MLQLLVSVLWLLALEMLFFIPDVLGSAWAEGKSILNLSGGFLLLVTLAFFAVAYVAKSLLQKRFKSMLLLDIAMAIASNAGAALADKLLFNREVNLVSLAVATIGLLMMTNGVVQLQNSANYPNFLTAVVRPRLKKYQIDVVIWIAILFVLTGVSLPKLAAQTGIPLNVVVPAVAFAASLFSKTGSLLQKQALREGASAEAFSQARYLRGLLGNLCSQVLLAHVSVSVGITGVSLLRAFFSFSLSTYTSVQEAELVWKDGWALIALSGFAIFLVSRLM